MDETGFSSPEAAGQEPLVPREEPQTSESRKALVKQWCDTVRGDKAHWRKAFKRMRQDQDFAFGRQWSDDEDDDRYVANIALRHVQQRVSALYAKNPRVVARVKPKLMSTVWDGSMSSVMSALQQVQVLGEMGGPMAAQNPMFAKSMTILQEAQAETEHREVLTRFARTYELLYQHNIAEQPHPFKAMMKLVVRRAVTSAVGYVKLGFQRVMESRAGEQLDDATRQLAEIERLSSDLGDGKLDDETSAEVERLRILVQDLQNQPEILVKEGLVFDYPDSTAIIPDRKCKQLREFLGCGHVSEEYVLTPEDVQKIYGVDVRQSYQCYRQTSTGQIASDGPNPLDEDTSHDLGTDEDAGKTLCVVWEIYCKDDGQVYTVCDGYPDFLREPAAPPVWIERFYPWFPLVLNEADHPQEIYPPSDVRLLMHQQREYNRLREGLREHRVQNRPLTASAKGVVSEPDKEILQNRPGNAHIELDALQPGQRIEDVLQNVRFAGVDPNLYETNPIFEDVLRVVGVQEANLGGATGNTATETSIAESSRMSSLQSNIDELDALLSEMARAAGQVLLANVQEQTVKQIVGPAAVWPEMSREELAREVHLEIEAGSTGRPNQAQEIQNFERIAPLLMAIPGFVPEKLAKEALRRLDDRLDIKEMYDSNLPSINAMNQLMGTAAGGPQQSGPDPNAPGNQGAEGANNARVPQRTAGAPGGPDMDRTAPGARPVNAGTVPA